MTTKLQEASKASRSRAARVAAFYRKMGKVGKVYREGQMWIVPLTLKSPQARPEHAYEFDIWIKDNGFEHVKDLTRYTPNELTKEIFYQVLKIK
jgi:hypothetical protein